MPETVGGRLKQAWNAFMNRDPPAPYRIIGPGYSYRPDRMRLTRGNERSIVTSVYNRIAMDCAAITIEHVKLDKNGRYLETINSGLNVCLTLRANKDQSARAFIQDAVLSMFDEGCIALTPIDTTIKTETDRSGKAKTTYDIESMRTAKIRQWYPDHVRLSVYNDRTGQPEEIIMPKSAVVILENPLYAVMNEPNSTVQRLNRKLNLLDCIDEQSGSGKLDLIIQLPYAIKTELRKKQAEDRRADIAEQLAGSKYGIAYTDGTERITQLNRPVENNLMNQVEYLAEMFYSQLGMTKSILDGTADEKTMQNYYSRSVEPIVSIIADGCKWKLLSESARENRESIEYFRDPFKLVPVSEIANIADKFTRNEILSSNELRQIIGRKPVDDGRADELRNKNLNSAKGQQFPSVTKEKEADREENVQNDTNV